MIVSSREIEIAQALKAAVCKRLCGKISEEALMLERRRLLGDYQAAIEAKKSSKGQPNTKGVFQPRL